MKKYHVVISIELDLYVTANNKEEAIDYVENMELPQGYRENSFKIEFIEYMN